MGYTWKILSCSNLEFPMDYSFITPLLCSGEIAPPPDSVVQAPPNGSRNVLLSRNSRMVLTFYGSIEIRSN